MNGLCQSGIIVHACLSANLQKHHYQLAASFSRDRYMFQRCTLLDVPIYLNPTQPNPTQPIFPSKSNPQNHCHSTHPHPSLTVHSLLQGDIFSPAKTNLLSRKDLERPRARCHMRNTIPQRRSRTLRYSLHYFNHHDLLVRWFSTRC